jgi:hypothetical protein
VNTSDGAKRWLVVSALIVAGVWGYRRMREGPAAVLDFPRFATAWGATYFTLALVAEASPRGAAAFSLLVATGDVLAQGSQLFGDVSSAAAEREREGRVQADRGLPGLASDAELARLTRGRFWPFWAPSPPSPLS